MAAWNTASPGTFGDLSLGGVGNWVWFAPPGGRRVLEIHER